MSRETTVAEQALVREWIEGRTGLQEMLEQMAPDHAPSAALLDLRNLVADRDRLKSVVNRARRVLKTDMDDDLRLLLGCLTASTCGKLGRPAVGSALLAGLPESRTHRLLNLIRLSTIGLLEFAGDNDAAAGRAFDRLVELADLDVPREARSWMNHAHFRINRLEGAPLIPTLARLTTHADPVTADVAVGLSWLHRALTGAADVPPRLRQSTVDMIGPSLVAGCAWQSLLNDLPLRQPSCLERVPDRNLDRAVLEVVSGLRDGQPAPSRRLTRLNRRQGRPALDPHGLLRDHARLASGTRLSRKRLSALQRRSPCAHPFDGFILIRQSLVTGRPDRERIDRLFDDVDRLGLQRRFEFESDLAHEVRASTWVSWCRSAPSSRGPTRIGLVGLEAGPRVRRRLEEILKLFHDSPALHRDDIARSTRTSRTTTSSDLKRLIGLGLIEKVTPTRSPRTHYFRPVG